jgi:hypothetical protein
MPLARVFAALSLAVSSASAASQITLQPCGNTTLYPQLLFTAASGAPIRTADGRCAGFAGGVLVADACGASPDTYTWAADGTVKSAATGECLNVDGAAEAPGTSIISYACGVATRAVAANDVFFFDAAAGTILANESALCLATAPVPPPPAPPAGSCVTSLDCNLNGECVNSACVCYKPWTAALDCSVLSFLPSPVVRGFPPPSRNETSWGGSIVLDPVGGKYHMYVAEMMNECPLNTWGRNSRCTHAVADAPEGPYETADIAVQNWCHNPAIILTKDASTGAPLYLLFHIGDGSGGATSNCSSGDAETATHSAPAAAGSTLHTAPGPNGPWTPASPLGSCNNPAPFLARNGSVFLVCNGFNMLRADGITAAGGNWVTVGPISATGNRIAGNYEDPFLYIDARGNFHILYHVYRTGPVGGDAHNCLPGHDGAVVSGHYFSLDGLKWQTSATMPYGNVIALADGSSQLLTTRERPKMLFNAEGEPTHLSNGVCPSPGGFNTPFSCPTVSTGCVDCKCACRCARGRASRAHAYASETAPSVTLPFTSLQADNDWDFTNVSPLDI